MSEQSAQLAGLVDARCACLRQLHELGARQLESIAGGDFTQLMRILAGKQRLLAQLEVIERSLDPFRRQAPDARSWSSPAERERCANVAAECQRLLAAVVIQEKQSEQRLVEGRKRAALELAGANSAAQALSAYENAGAASPSQLDLSSHG